MRGICVISGLLLSASAQAACLQFFPFFFLLTIELAWQRFYGNVVLLAEVSPEDEAQIKCAGFIGDDVVYPWFFVFRHDSEAPPVSWIRKFSRFIAARSCLQNRER